MRKAIVAIILAICFVAVGVASFAAHHAVKVAKKDGVGSFITDTEGMTLYWFKNDSVGKSACKDACVEKWPLYYREKVAPKDGLTDADFGAITREDGKPQTTFRGYPLYYFAGDKAAGDTSGNKVKDVWFVIDPANFPPMKP